MLKTLVVLRAHDFERSTGYNPTWQRAGSAFKMTWVGRLLRLCPITAASQELVRFDLQKEQNPEIAGVEYQQGTLAGCETREYLLLQRKEFHSLVTSPPSLGVGPTGDLVTADVVRHQQHRQLQRQPGDLDRPLEQPHRPVQR
jgi:hypothetical protein